ncbi:MAG: helix-turn-helix transcriptional regulator [Acidobacteriales bacterium]|nr:helix-turn-helix transcriptional regulator [Terriglobales bacterium]
MSLHELQSSSIHAAVTDPQPNSGADPRIAVALGFLSGPTSSLPLVDAARELNLSSSRLRHLLRKATGVSANRYVKRQRLLQARELLEATFLSVKEVVYLVGLRDYSHGVRDYKAEFGETPSQSRVRAWRSGTLAESARTMTHPVPLTPAFR